MSAFWKTIRAVRVTVLSSVVKCLQIHDSNSLLSCLFMTNQNIHIYNMHIQHWYMWALQYGTGIKIREDYFRNQNDVAMVFAISETESIELPSSDTYIYAIYVPTLLALIVTSKLFWRQEIIVSQAGMTAMRGSLQNGVITYGRVDYWRFYWKLGDSVSEIVVFVNYTLQESIVFLV